MTQPSFHDSARNVAQIALGANVTVGAQSLGTALQFALGALDVPQFSLIAQSRFFKTPCFPVGAGPDYVNAAASFDTRLSALAILTHLHRVETAMGRQRVQRWGRRTMDLDLLALGDTVLPDLETHAIWRTMPLDQQMRQAPDYPILPHPRMHERAFVLIPLAEIAPDWTHPILGKTVRQMRDALPAADKSTIVPLSSGQVTGI